jgi:hypothetical protein
MNKQAILAAAIIAIMLSPYWAGAVPVATVSTYAAYDTYTDSDSDTSFDPMVPAEAHALAKHPSEWYNGASDAQATIGGSVGAYCFAYGAYHETISATANASNTAEWLVTSSTLPPGTPIYVLTDVTFNGRLGSDPYSTPYASASASLSVDDFALYEGSGTYSSGSTLDSSGAWIGDFTKSGWYYLLDTTDRIGFEAVVGQTLLLTLSLQTDVYVPDASESGATADFLDSGWYVFAGAEDPLNPGTMLDVSFEMVPEPATLLLLGPGIMLLRRRR